MYLTQSIHKALREQRHAVAAICGDEQRRWDEMAERIARLAAALQTQGVKPGDRVGMLALNSIRYLEYFYGCWWAGAVVNPVNIRWNPHEVAYSLDDCDTQVLIVDDAFAGMAAQLRTLSKSLRTVIFCGHGEAPEGALHYEALLAAAEPVPDAYRQGNDLAAVMYTGGTTGRPKGVMLSHGNLFINALSNAASVPRPEANVTLIVAPMFHVAGCGLALIAAQQQSPQVIVPFFDEPAILAAIQAHGAKDLFLVPTMIKRLIEHPRFADFDVSSLKLLRYGAAPIEAALLTQAMQALPGVEFAQAYGMTELAPTIAVLAPADHHEGPQRDRLLRAAGRPVPIAEVRIVDAHDRELPVGEVGEITARGPMTMQGYWNRPEESAAALKGGWMHTGDMGRMEADGYLFVVDRLKDMIVSGGENVYSAEVENALAQLPQVSMSAVIGVPDEQWGERVHAVIVLREGMHIDEAGVMAHCKSLIASYKCPRSVEFRPELPLSAAGKLQKFQLREPYWRGRARGVN